MVAALQVKLVSRGAFGRAPGEAGTLLAGKAEPEVFRNLTGDLFLYRDKVREPAIVLVSPDLGAGGGLHQVGLDGEDVASLDDSSGEQHPDLEVAADFLRVNLAPFKLEDG